MYTVEEFDEKKIQVMKYVIYKKRTEQEIRNKFNGLIEENLLEDIIQYLKDAEYINDKEYINKLINNFKILKNLSKVEIRYKLLSKGVRKNDVEDYFYDNKEELNQYEIKSASNIIIKKQKDMDIDEIKQYLLKKGYNSDNIQIAIEESEI